MKIDIAGNISGTSGFANHTRNLILSLNKIGVDVRFEGTKPQSFSDCLSYKDNILLKEVISKTPHFDKADKTIMIDLPNGWVRKYGSRFNELNGFCVFEGSKLPLYWEELMGDERLDRIMYPSNEVGEALTRSGLWSKSVLIPHGVDTEVFNPSNTPLNFPGKKEDHYYFIFVGGWKDGVRDRKGLDYALKAFDQAFERDEKVSFIAKLNPAYGFSVDPIKEIQKIGLRPILDRPEITVVTNSFPSEILAQFYRIKGCLVNPSKSEGFGLNVFEAVASGMPVISTNTGYVTNIKNGESMGIRKVSFDGTTPATGEPWIYEEASWGVPCVDDMSKAMRQVYENRDKWAGNAVKGSKWIGKNLTWECSAKKIQTAQ